MRLFLIRNKHYIHMQLFAVNAYCDKKAEEVIVRQQLVNMLPIRARDFPPFHSDKTNTRDNLTSNLISLGLKQPGCESNHISI
jgi:hypothetical protein